MKPDSRRKLQLVLAAIYYFALICFVLRPASPWDQNSLPIKQKNLQVVAMFNAWTIWWNAESLTTAKANYWQAPIFHPDEFSLAYSEPQPATLMVAPILWAGNSPARAYLVYLYASLFLNAFVTLLLVQARSRSVFVGFVAGAFVLMLPLVHASLDVLQLVPIWAIVWTWISASKLLRQPSLQAGTHYGFRVRMRLFDQPSSSLDDDGPAWVHRMVTFHQAIFLATGEFESGRRQFRHGHRVPFGIDNSESRQAT